MRRSFKKRISLLMIIFMFGLVITGCIGNKTETLTQAERLETLTQAEKIEDFEYMFKVIEENYPYLEVNKRVNDIDWLAKKDEFMEEIKKSKNDEAFLYKLGDILGQLNNGHTHILNKSHFEYMFPIYSNLDGYKSWYEELSKPQALKRYGYDLDKEVDKSQSEIENNYSSKDNIETKVLDDNIAYMKIKSFNFFNVESDKDAIKSFIKEIKPLDALIIDIRGNGGGSTQYWSENIVPLLIQKELSTDVYYFTRGGDFTDKFFKRSNRKPIESIENFKGMKELPPEILTDFEYYVKSNLSVKPKESINFKGKVFLLVDKKVYSSSEMFAVFAKESGFATLIGERTGGDGIGSDPAVCTLPNSGIVLRFTKEMGTTESGVCNEEMKTIPHYTVDANIRSNIKDDKCIQKAIELIGK